MSRDDDARLSRAVGRFRTAMGRLYASLPPATGVQDPLREAVDEVHHAALEYAQVKGRLGFAAGVRATLEMRVGPAPDQPIGGPHEEREWEADRAD